MYEKINTWFQWLMNTINQSTRSKQSYKTIKTFSFIYYRVIYDINVLEIVVKHQKLTKGSNICQLTNIYCELYWFSQPENKKKEKKIIPMFFLKSLRIFYFIPTRIIRLCSSSLASTTTTTTTVIVPKLFICFKLRTFRIIHEGTTLLDTIQNHWKLLCFWY